MIITEEMVKRAISLAVPSAKAILAADGEYLYPGGVSQFGISAGASGAKGRTDEALADILVCIIMMLANLETDRRKEAKEMQV